MNSKSFSAALAIGQALTMDPKHPNPQDKQPSWIPPPRPRTFAYFEVRKIAGPNGFVFNVWFVIRREYSKKPLEQKKVGGPFKNKDHAEAFRANCRVTNATETVAK